jgi:hypothetical protein
MPVKGVDMEQFLQQIDAHLHTRAVCGNRRDAVAAVLIEEGE